MHFTDEEESITDRDNPNFDKLYKIQPFLNRICGHFLEEYIPDKNLAVDETMVPFKGIVKPFSYLGIVKPFSNKDYHDRFYTSPFLLHCLQHHKVYGCGTVMSYGKFFPKDFTERALQCGDSQWRQDHSSGMVSNSLDG